MYKSLLCFISIFVAGVDCGNKHDNVLDCTGKSYHNVSMTAYYPDFDGKRCEYLDLKEKKLRTLQDYLEGKADFVTLSMDRTLGLAYGTKACIPELNRQYGKKLDLQVRDAGSNLLGTRWRRTDICVRTEADSYGSDVNRVVTLVISNDEPSI